MEGTRNFQCEYDVLLASWDQYSPEQALNITESIDELRTLAGACTGTGASAIRRDFQQEYDLISLGSTIAEQGRRSTTGSAKHDVHWQIDLAQCLAEVLADARSAGAEVREWNRSTAGAGGPKLQWPREMQ